MSGPPRGRSDISAPVAESLVTAAPDDIADDPDPDDAACFKIRCIDLCDDPQVYGLLYGFYQATSESRPDLDLRSAALATGWPPASCVSWTAAAYCNQKLVGLVLVTDLAQSDHGEVRLIVDARWGRSGIPSALMQATMAWAVTQRKSELRFICPRNNWPMRSLLEESGARLDLAFGEIVARVPIDHANRETRTTEPFGLLPPDAGSPSIDHAGGPQQEITQSMESRCDVSLDENELERLKLGLDTLRAYNHKGIIVVASVWLVLYVIMLVGHLTAPTN